MTKPSTLIVIAGLNFLVGIFDLPLGIVGIAIGHIVSGMILAVIGIINLYLSFKLFNLWWEKT